MGLFNTIIDTPLICPSCRRSAPFRVQFKYGGDLTVRLPRRGCLRWGIVKPPWTDLSWLPDVSVR